MHLLPPTLLVEHLYPIFGNITNVLIELSSKWRASLGEQPRENYVDPTQSQHILQFIQC